MDSLKYGKKEWVLTQQAFDRLLNSFDADRNSAGEKYERMRYKLVKYFEWRRATSPDVEADETINRVARKINEGAEIHNLNAYFYGVARLVFVESLKTKEREREALSKEPQQLLTPTEDDETATKVRDCLDDCILSLSGENRELIMAYYLYESKRKIASRKDLAARLGIPLNALRIRAHRIRLTLEACVTKCSGQEGMKSNSFSAINV